MFQFIFNPLLFGNWFYFRLYVKRIRKKAYSIGCEFLTAVVVNGFIFWVIKPCGPVAVSQAGRA
jgi:hypothetical protein